MKKCRDHQTEVATAQVLHMMLKAEGGVTNVEIDNVCGIQGLVFISIMDKLETIGWITETHLGGETLFYLTDTGRTGAKFTINNAPEVFHLWKLNYPHAAELWNNAELISRSGGPIPNGPDGLNWSQVKVEVDGDQFVIGELEGSFVFDDEAKAAAFRSKVAKLASKYCSPEGPIVDFSPVIDSKVRY